MVGFPNTLPMGWVHSPPYFSAATETGADLMNRYLNKMDDGATNLPRHRLEELALREAATDVANNVTTSARTKHVDVRYRYVNALIDEEGLVTIKFVKSEENDSDGFTKNLSGDLHDKHKVKFLADRRDIENIGKTEIRDLDEDQVATGRVLESVAHDDSKESNIETRGE